MKLYQWSRQNYVTGTLIDRTVQYGVGTSQIIMSFVSETRRTIIGSVIRSALVPWDVLHSLGNGSNYCVWIWRRVPFVHFHHLYGWVPVRIKCRMDTFPQRRRTTPSDNRQNHKSLSEWTHCTVPFCKLRFPCAAEAKFQYYNCLTVVMHRLLSPQLVIWRWTFPRSVNDYQVGLRSTWGPSRWNSIWDSTLY